MIISRDKISCEINNTFLRTTTKLIKQIPATIDMIVWSVIFIIMNLLFNILALPWSNSYHIKEVNHSLPILVVLVNWGSNPFPCIFL